jgi:ABC-type molybdate transport system substrate-binding protein
MSDSIRQVFLYSRRCKAMRESIAAPRAANEIYHAELRRQFFLAKFSLSTWLTISIVGKVVGEASDPAGAKALLECLASPEAQTIFKDAGFQPHS